MKRDQQSLTVLARAGFSDLGVVRERLDEVEELTGFDADGLLAPFARSADPDDALRSLVALLRHCPEPVLALLRDPPSTERLVRVLGASPGLTEFFLRQPAELSSFARPVHSLPHADELRRDLLDSVGAVDGFSAVAEEAGWTALRTRYRHRLVEIAGFDLQQDDPAAGLDDVARALADLAAAALDAALAVARTTASGTGAGTFPAAEVGATRLAVIGMGKAGASELNYVSDVDVIFVAAASEGFGLEPGRAVDIATRLAVLMMRGIDAPALEPGLWEVDPNLRPEGKAGALVRTLESHLAYYDRWAKGWEFQALLKARPLAGDIELGERYVEALSPKVWASSSRENFVESVQRMRERVTDHIPDDELEFQLKLGPGGLRDIEFTVQLLQLVHGQTDELVRQRGTLPALAGLASQGYIGRAEATEFAQDYRVLRLMEHRLQLRYLRRTHLMPRDADDQRILARATGLASGAVELRDRWA